MITTTKVINIPITSHSYLFLFSFVVRTLKMYFLSELQMYNTVLLALITILYIFYPQNLLILQYHLGRNVLITEEI